MRDTRARQLLVTEARRLALLHQVIDSDIAAAHGDARPASDSRGPSAAALTLQHEVEESLRAAVDDERSELALAFARLDAGTYGSCVRCGAQIADERLEVVPGTRFCVGCEARGEAGTSAAGMPMIDMILRTALRDVDSWADDGPDEDDVVVPAPEEGAMHRTGSSRRS